MKKYWFLLLFLIKPLSAQEQEVTLKDLSGGIYTNASSNKIPDNSAAWIQNFTTDIESLATERNGYIKRDSTILGGTKPVYGLWEFVDSSGNDWIISYSSRTYYKNTIGGTPTAFGPVATVDQIPDCAKNLGILMCVNGTDSVWTFDGVSTAAVSGAPLGTHVEAWRNRFAISNITNSKSTVRFSADGSTTTWTLGGNPTDAFSIQIGGANDGDYVRCLVGSYLDSMIIGRKYDLWALDGFDQVDVVLRNISKNIGCIEPRSVQEVDGQLVFLSGRGLETMDARTITSISEPVRDITDTLVKNTVNLRTNIQTTQSDFDAGTISPTGKLSTTVTPGAVTLSTSAVITFADNQSTDFSSGTVTSLVSTIPVHLSFNPDVSSYGSLSASNDECSDSCTGSYYQAAHFVVTSSQVASAAFLKVYSAGIPGDYTVNLRLRGVDNSLGTIVQTTTLPASSVSATTTTVKINLSSSTALVLGTSYWLQLIPQSTCNSLNYIRWVTFTFVSGSTSTFGCGANSNTTGERYDYAVYTTTYVSSGNLISRVFDVGQSTAAQLWAWGVLADSETVPSSTGLTFQTQTSSDSASFESLVSVSTGAAPTSTVRRYIRYKASFTTNSPNLTPTLSSVTLPTGRFISTGGVFTSQLISIGNLISTWGPLSISDVQSAGTIAYQFGSTNTASVSAITNWTNVANGGIPTVSTNPYAAFRSTFVATTGSANLLLQEFQTAWTDGGVVPSPVSIVYDRRYWLSYTTSTASAPALDTILVLQRNKSFTLFRGINAGSFTLWRDKLYFGNSDSTGYVYNFDIGNSDDNSNIISSIQTKSYDLGASYRDKDFRSSYVQYLSNANFSGLFTASYDVDRLGQNFSLGSANMNEGTGQLAIKFPFPFSNPVKGRELQYKISKTGTGDRLRLHDITLKYNLEEER